MFVRDIAAVIRATQVSPLRCGVFVRGIAADRRGGRGGTGGIAARRRATMHVGAPFMTPGAGNGTTRSWHCVGRCTRWCRKIAILRRSSGRHKCRPYVAGCSSAELRRSSGRHKCRPYVAGCSAAESRRSSGRHKCRPYGAGCSSTELRRSDGAGRWCRRHCGATTRDNARRGAIYDAQCQNGTTRPWHCVGRCTRWCRQIAILRRSSGRHKCRPYGAGYSSAESRQSSYGRGMFVRGIAADRRGGRGGAGGGAARRRATMHVGAPFMTPGAGTARPVRGIALGRCTRWCRKIAILRRTDRATQVSPLRCRVFVRGIAAVIRATQVSPLRRGVFVRGIAAVIRATQVSPLQRGMFVRDVAAVIRATQVSPLRRVVFVRGVAAVIRATQVSPLRCGMFVRDVAAGRGCQRSTISTTGTVFTNSRLVT